MDQVRVRDSGAAHCPARPPGPALPLRPQGRDSGIQSSQTSARPMTPPEGRPWTARGPPLFPTHATGLPGCVGAPLCRVKRGPGFPEGARRDGPQKIVDNRYASFGAQLISSLREGGCSACGAVVNWRVRVFAVRRYAARTHPASRHSTLREGCEFAASKGRTHSRSPRLRWRSPLARFVYCAIASLRGWQSRPGPTHRFPCAIASLREWQSRR